MRSRNREVGDSTSPLGTIFMKNSNQENIERFIDWRMSKMPGWKYDVVIFF